MTDLAGINSNNDIKKEKKERNYLFDNIKAVLIFSVVIAHYYRMSSAFAQPTFGGAVYAASFSYIMQGFLFVSGYFSRNPDKCRATAFRTFLFPYLILMPVMYGIRFLLFGRANLDLTLPTMALWYLLTLFIYRFMLKDLIRIKYILPISVIVSLAAGFVPFLNSTLSLGRTFSFLPFFLLGYYFREAWIVKLRNLPKPAGAAVLLLLLAASAGIAFAQPFPLEALFMKASYGASGLTWYHGFLVRIAILLISCGWIFVFLNLAPTGKTVLSTIGQGTMTVYVLHIVVRYVIKYFGNYFGQDPGSYLLLTAAAVFSVWYFSRPAASGAYHAFMDLLYRWFIFWFQVLKKPFE